MNYEQTIKYLYSQLPLFTRVGVSAYKANLNNTIALCQRLENPQNKFKSVHIGGTNGKGSTSHMLAAILQTAGYKTGLCTSPHLKDFRERIRVNGEMISEQEVIDFVGIHKGDFDDIQPSFFEMTVALAFDVFAKEKVDIAVVEVGMGGRLDSTNIITPLLSVITNIGWDHMNILGNTLQLIAGEKAGIIKNGIPVIIGEYQPEVVNVFVDKAIERNAPISFASEIFTVLRSEVRYPKSEVGSRKSEVRHRDQRLEVGDQKSELIEPDQYLEVEVARSLDFLPNSDFRLPTSELLPSTSDLRPPTFDFLLDLTGSYQLKNIKTVLSVVEELRRQGFLISDDQVATALKQVKKLTGLHGRWEILSRDPLTICDTGHNPEGIAEVLKNINAVSYDHLHFVIGMVNDKDHSKVLNMLPKDATYYFCKPDIPRGLDAENLRQQAADFGLRGEAYPSVIDAFCVAQKNAGNNDLVFVGGSTFVVAEVI